MSKQALAYIPPLSADRALGTYHFEGGGFVAIVVGGNVETAEAINMAEQLIDLKRKELATQSVG